MRFQRALITGASSGLGHGIARELARRGAAVVLCARRTEPLDALAAEIRTAGGHAVVERLDVTEAAAVQAVVARQDDAIGGFDLVLANAGISPLQGEVQGPGGGPGAAADKLAWHNVERVLATNLVGACATLCAALPRFRARGHGTLAAITSLAALRGFPDSGAYSASKAGLSTFLESLGADLAGSGVRVVDIQPGFVRTPLLDGFARPTPFLLELEPAVQRCVNGLERGRAIVHFPAAMSWSLRLVARPLPRALWIALARRLKPPLEPPGAPPGGSSSPPPGPPPGAGAGHAASPSAPRTPAR